MTTARSTIYIVGIATGLSLCFALRDSARRRERDQARRNFQNEVQLLRRDLEVLRSDVARIFQPRETAQ
jgi:hypothetical protein